MLPRLPLSDERAVSAARWRQARLTKPPGSLGRLEQLAVQLAGWQANATPRSRPAAAVLFAADHPVVRHGVSAYPSAVTRAMLRNFVQGGAAASVMAKAQQLPLVVVDVGVLDGRDQRPDSEAAVMVLRDPVADHPAGDIRIEDAMSAECFEHCLAAGRRVVRRFEPGLRVLVLGEIGIGNTTPAAAVCAAMLGGDPGEFVGAGAGTEGAALENKRDVVRDAVRRLAGVRDPLEVVRRAGGREIAALLGAMMAALERRTTVLVDGFIVTSAALVLARLLPGALAGMVFAHQSDEHAHVRVLAELGAQPLLQLGLRLGEGSGALLAMPILDLACSLHARMATFESADIPDRKPEP